MYDFGISPDKITDSGQRILDRAISEANRREHALITNEHVFLAFIQIEWDLFARVLRDLELNPHEFLSALENHLGGIKRSTGKQLTPTPTVKLLFKLALLSATRGGRHVVEPVDIFAALFEDEHGVPGLIIRRFNLKRETIALKIVQAIQKDEAENERLKRKFDLPPVLKHFATNLNQLARQGKILPVYGREKEIAQVLEILCHRERANSVVLVGEPGVGKTAIAEGLAYKLEFQPEEVPIRLRDCQIVNLQMNILVAGTMLRGMFEDRIQNVIREIKDRPRLILFIDELHTMIGAGSALGAPIDAANVFKSVLARGEVRVIGGTTLSEYKEYIQEDEALSRRFRTVQVDEPTIEETRTILYNLRPRLERNYSVKIRDEALETALEMSPRYMRHLRLPDKVIGWLDTASVRSEIKHSSDVSRQDIVEVIATAARIPVDMVFREVSERFKSIRTSLSSRVVGQHHAIESVANQLTLNKGPLKDGFDRPDGVLLFLGPTGVGKTELAKSVAEFLFGDENKMIRIDMSEYQDNLAVDKLIGMPRGIVGSERGGTLTNQLKDNPYSVVLLDEVDKASQVALNLFLQAFDEGWITDGRGRRVYLSDAVVIMTANTGSHIFRKLTSPLGFSSGNVSVERIKSEVIREFETKFSPEFRNRIDEVVIFAPLTKEEVRKIAVRYLKAIELVIAKRNKSLTIYEDALDLLIDKGHSLQYGARRLKRVIDRAVKIPISQMWEGNDKFYLKAIAGQVLVDLVTNGSRIVELKDEAEAV